MFQGSLFNPGFIPKNEILTTFATIDYWFLVPLLNLTYPIYLAITHNINQFDRPARFVDYIKREFRLAKKVNARSNTAELVFLDHNSSMILKRLYGSDDEIWTLSFTGDGDDTSLIQWFVGVKFCEFFEHPLLGSVRELSAQEFFGEFHKRHQKR